MEISAPGVAAKDAPGLPVFALRFSPDGRKLAIIAGAYREGQERESDLFVVDLSHPSAMTRRFRVAFGVVENENGRGAALNFGWTPSGEIVYAAGTVIHLTDGKACQLSNQAVFLSDELAVSARGQDPPLFDSTQLTFYNQDCREDGVWEVPEGWLISDVSTDRHLISVLRSINGAVPGERLIVDPLMRRVIARWREDGGGIWLFTDSGRVVCQGGAVLNSDRALARCRSVDTGQQLAETTSNGVTPISTAARARRVVVSDYRRRKIPFSYEYDTTFHGRYIWDFGTGQEFARWHPDSESYPNVFSPGKTVTEPFRFAISPDGEYMAEGGNGIVHLYKVEP